MYYRSRTGEPAGGARRFVQVTADRQDADHSGCARRDSFDQSLDSVDRGDGYGQQ